MVLLTTVNSELAGVQAGGAATIVAEETMAMTLQPGPRGVPLRCIPRATMS